MRYFSSHLARFTRTPNLDGRGKAAIKHNQRANVVFLQQILEGKVDLFHPKMKKQTKKRRKQ